MEKEKGKLKQINNKNKPGSTFNSSSPDLLITTEANAVNNKIKIKKICENS